LRSFIFYNFFAIGIGFILANSRNYIDISKEKEEQ